MTKKLYLDNTYLFHSDSIIQSVNKDEKNHYLILDQTIFYPQGGGQPSDQGILKVNNFTFNIIMVKTVNDEIRHYLDNEIDESFIGKKVECIIDEERRIVNSKYHTSAHLLGNIIEEIYPGLKAIKGHSFPNEAYVGFSSNADLSGKNIDILEIQEAVNNSIKKDIKNKIFEIDRNSFEKKYYKLPYEIPDNKEFRVLQIGDYLPVPCGGTHLNSIGEIGTINISKIKIKNDIVNISYGL